MNEDKERQRRLEDVGIVNQEVRWISKDEMRKQL